MWTTTITNNGLNLISSAITGDEKLTFTHLEVGSGLHSNPQLADGTQNFCADVDIVSVTQSGGGVTVTVYGTVKTNAFSFSEFALFAQLGDDDPSVIAYGINDNPDTFGGDLPSTQQILHLEIAIPFSNVSNVNLEMNNLILPVWEKYGHGRYKNIIEAMAYSKHGEICTVEESIQLALPSGARFLQQLGKYILFGYPYVLWSGTAYKPTEEKTYRELYLISALDILNSDCKNLLYQTDPNEANYSDVPTSRDVAWETGQKELYSPYLINSTDGVLFSYMIDNGFADQKTYIFDPQQNQQMHIKDLEGFPNEDIPEELEYPLAISLLGTRNGEAFINMFANYDNQYHVLSIDMEGISVEPTSIHAPTHHHTAITIDRIRANGEQTPYYIYNNIQSNERELFNLEGEYKELNKRHFEFVSQTYPCTILGGELFCDNIELDGGIKGHNPQISSGIDPITNVGNFFDYDGAMLWTGKEIYLGYGGISLPHLGAVSEHGFMANCLVLRNNNTIILYVNGFAPKVYNDNGHLIPYEIIF